MYEHHALMFLGIDHDIERDHSGVVCLALEMRYMSFLCVLSICMFFCRLIHIIMYTMVKIMLMKLLTIRNKKFEGVTKSPSPIVSYEGDQRHRFASFV